MKYFSIFSLSISLVAASLCLGSANQVQAYMEQHQTSSSEVKIECTGTCSSSATSSMHQSQYSGSDDRSEYRRGRMSDDRHDWSRKWEDVSRDGKVTLEWDYRGGTCHVRYTEANARSYKYSTSAACDDGQISVGGLVQGKSYRFQVKQDNGGWTRAVNVRAW